VGEYTLSLFIQDVLNF